MQQHGCTMETMVSDKMPQHMVPSNQEILGPVIPTRSSSMSRTRTTRREQQNPTFRHSLFTVNGPETNHLSATGLSQETFDQSTGLRRMQSSPGTKRRAASCSRVSKSLPVPSSVQRWAGLTRSVCNWDGLRRVRITYCHGSSKN